MATPSGQVEIGVLQSKWDGLSPLLIARFYPVQERRDSNTNKVRWERVPGSKIVGAPLTDTASMEISLNWQSPFENSGTESKAPAMAAMLQSGALQPLINEMRNLGDKVTGGAFGLAKKAQEESNSFMQKFAGRTGITKLNSTQVFSGMPPVKFSVTALFRAWEDAAKEVEQPFDQLMQWALPQELSEDGTLIVSGARAAQGTSSYVEALMPSMAPTKIFMDYKGRTYGPLVIESVGVPINAGITSDGKYAELSVPLTICSLTAIDRSDWSNIQTGGLKK